MTPWLIIVGSYLAISPGIDSFVLPKLLAIFVGVALSLNPKREWKQRRLRPIFLTLIASAALSGLLSGSPWQSLLGEQRSPTMGVLGLLAAWLCYEAGEPGWERPLLWGAGGCATVAFIQYLPGFPFPPVSGRAFGTIGSPPLMACMLALAAPSLPPAAMLPILVAVVLSGSRAGILGCLAGLAWGLWPKLRLRGALAGVIIAALWAGSHADGDNMRLQTWAVAARAWWEHPWLGVGPDCFTDTFMRLRGADWLAGYGTVQGNAHNLPLDILAKQGILGALTWGLMWISVPTVAPLVAVIVYGMFDPVPFMAWCVLAYQLGAQECES